MSVSDEVHAELRRRLIAGRFDPGEKLREEHVAAEFGVSRTPVRAAIHRLVSEGLLQAAPNRGAVVTEWRDSDTEEIFALRVLAEGQAAAWAAQRIGQAELAHMERLNAAIADSVARGTGGLADEIQQANLGFHMALFEACGSARLRMFGTSLLDYPLVVGGFFLYTPEDVRESVRQHAEILNALRAGNAEWARSAATAHLYAALERFRASRRDPPQD